MKLSDEVEQGAGTGRPLRERLLERIGAEVPAEEAEALTAFAGAYLRRLASGAAEELDAAELLAEIRGAYALADGRDGRPRAVRALNPTREADGYEPAGSVLETNTPDLPFLVDSVSAALEARGLGIRRLQHPIVAVEREEDGTIARIAHPGEPLPRESVMHFELDLRLEADALDALAEATEDLLAQLERVVADFPAMQARLEDLRERVWRSDARYGEEEREQTAAFLGWLVDQRFIFLGYREYDFAREMIEVVPGSGLGLLADETRSSYARPVSADSLAPAVRDIALGGDLLTIMKTNGRSPVHRRTRMDSIAVRRVDERGAITGEFRFIGLFTTRAYADPASETPVLEGKLRRIRAEEDLVAGSHDDKAVVALFESFPKDELFAAPTESLRRAIVALLGMDGDEVRLLGRRSPDERSASLIVVVPGHRYGAELIERVREFVAAQLRADSVEVQLVLGEEPVRVHLAVHAAAGLARVDFRALEGEVASLARTWDDRIAEALATRVGARRARALLTAWADRLPEYYKASVHPELAVADLLQLQALEGSGSSFAVGVQNEGRLGTGLTRVALYKHGGKAELSKVMPILEHLGLRVVEEVPSRLLGGDGETWVQDFGVLGADGRPLDLARTGTRVAECVAAVWRGEAESDSLNRLVLVAGLDWRRVGILRAYRKYRQRIGSRFTEGYQNDVLAANSGLTALLVRYFEARFDPQEEDPEATQEHLRHTILSGLEDVDSLDEDRILRNQLGLIEATKRTNAYQPGRAAIAFKLRSEEVPAIPQPAPLWEIYVYSPAMEGIHLRAGEIARGGIRWSDRQDYRTEVYGLMRAQVTKNVIIVPTGAKGGFLLKAPPQDRAALAEEVRRQYVAYIRALLSVTDDLVDGEIRHPAGVRVLDGEDPYLVVAADKGTATFSDEANAVAQEMGFWLDDAFASGGSAGYDHKALGITARGAWESVKRHFAELGLDPARDPITVCGIGDMSGDVFGNGMLLSQSIRLVGAYDHRHVFLDPDPDRAAAWAERRRLFGLAGSSWDDYDRERISAGGGVWPRSAKSIPLSPEARAVLGVEEAALAPTEVVRAILRAPVDLLWNGGIGTVVKSSTETDADAQDRASDAIRIDASELRCRVVAEGGNLGLTRLARVEYAREGGRVNGDFVDNSAGVDCSDHEVNLKILLGLAERAGELSRDDRDVVLAQATDEVCAHVLYDSFLQAQILSQEVEVAPRRTYAYEDLMASLEGEGMLHRDAERLPAAAELAERRRAGEGLVRPELAILVAYAKRQLTQALIASSLPDDPWLERDLRDYFPTTVVERFGAWVGEHPLRRQLVATIEANAVVNALGPTFVSQLVAERGAAPAEVVRAYRIASEVTDAGPHREAVEALAGKVPAEVSARLMRSTDRLVEAVTRWYLAWAPGADLGSAVREGRAGFAALVEALADVGSEETRAAEAATARELVAQGVPEALAAAHARLGVLEAAPDITAVAAASGRPVADAARAVLHVGDRLRVGWLARELEGLRTETRTQRWALQAVREDLLHARRQVAERALADGEDLEAEAAVDLFLDTREAAGRRLSRFLGSLTADDAVDLTSLTLAVRHLRTLAEAP